MEALEPRQADIPLEYTWTEPAYVAEGWKTDKPVSGR